MRNAVIMKNAWMLARKGVQRYGGKATDYIAESMKLAWSMHKALLNKKGGDILSFDLWFIKKKFGHDSMIQQINESPIHILKSTDKAHFVKMIVKAEGKEVASDSFWVPKSVCI